MPEVFVSLREQFPPDLYSQVEIGEGSYGGLAINAYDRTTRLQMGKFCSVAEGVRVVLGGEHRVDWATTYPFSVIWPEIEKSGHPATRGDVVIGNDVWLGTEALIASGTTIGDGAVVAARTLVVGRVPPYAVWGGNPGRFLRWRFAPDLCERLRALAWWDWPRERLVRALPSMLSTDVAAFVAAAEKGDL